MGETAPVTERAQTHAPAWRGGFGRLWAAAAVSKFGDSLRIAAMPLLAVSLTDDPLLIASVTACGYLPWLLFGLVGGAVADRVDQRRAMWIADVVRGVLMAGFAVAVWLDAHSIALLIAVAFVLTVLQTVFDNAATALLPSLVPAAALGSANARLMTTQQIVGSFLSTPAVPVLLAAGAAVPYAVDAATYAAAAVLVASLRTPRTPGPPRAPGPAGSTLRGQIAEGLRHLWQDRALRGLCIASTICNIGMGALIATLVVHVTDWLDAGTAGYAAVLTAFGAGSVVGGLTARRLADRIGRIRSVFLAGLVQTGALLAMGSVRALWATVAAMAVFAVMGMVWNVNQTTLTQQRSPAGMLGRVSAAIRTLTVAGVPLGALLGGAVAGALGPNAPALLAAALFVPAVAALSGLIN
ncbi:MFS transporter [Streptomyces sp. HNM0663]|uniref:MFS transporter n=1 Tax=Streptomyces chengmaiensis TaxID=3040919 RepID=A0ABT6HNK8_9ACTN|nr:MFS transporter [Streptomyces chengmaiensis]MDH2390311.1 MFS transporter [Streptomyces chengmaiensis]